MLEAGLALPSSPSPVLRSVRVQLPLTSVARVLLLSSAARELVGVQNVQYGERGGPVPVLEKSRFSPAAPLFSMSPLSGLTMVWTPSPPGAGSALSRLITGWTVSATGPATALSRLITVWTPSAPGPVTALSRSPSEHEENQRAGELALPPPFISDHTRDLAKVVRPLLRCLLPVPSHGTHDATSLPPTSSHGTHFVICLPLCRTSGSTLPCWVDKYK
ncbi:hypothetical protein EYF80_025879 [Liparis tanakae]|uniref:Uncharacterized protein n=1 Tax=Liparis tanakae TaxID=230148 RepID=A0A4Z2HF14_9TELE|nr:hypothetical protein EYF80_025879 [Liparis tanakae]